MDNFEIKFDDKNVQCRQGCNLLKCILDNGFYVPSLCNNEKCNKENACMVCAVFDKDTNQFVPSCSITVNRNFDIEVNTERVRNFRKSIIELLLSEHSGDCYAPCQRACPYDFNIPVFLEKINAEKFEEASNMTLEKGMDCEKCGYRCEKACRKKILDKSVGISQLIKRYKINNFEKKIFDKKSVKDGYSHKFGKVDAEILNNLKKTGSDINGCLQCHCKGVKKCKLKKISSEYNAEQYAYQPANKTRFERYCFENISFEPGKCVRCGICVSLLENKNLKESLSFQFRGRKTIPHAPIGVSWNDCLKYIDREIAANCPTGALCFYE